MRTSCMCTGVWSWRLSIFFASASPLRTISVASPSRLDSAASRQGVQAGSVVTEVNGESVGGLDKAGVMAKERFCVQGWSLPKDDGDQTDAPTCARNNFRMILQI